MIVDAAAIQGLQLSNPQEFHSVTGKGIKGIVDGRRVAVGNLALMAEVGALKPATGLSYGKAPGGDAHFCGHQWQLCRQPRRRQTD